MKGGRPSPFATAWASNSSPSSPSLLWQDNAALWWGTSVREAVWETSQCTQVWTLITSVALVYIFHGRERQPQGHGQCGPQSLWWGARRVTKSSGTPWSGRRATARICHPTAEVLPWGWRGPKRQRWQRWGFTFIHFMGVGEFSANISHIINKVDVGWMYGLMDGWI